MMNNPILQTILKNNPAGSANMLFNQMMKNNPQFKNFVEENRGKSPQQIAAEHGINYNDILSFMK